MSFFKGIRDSFIKRLKTEGKGKKDSKEMEEEKYIQMIRIFHKLPYSLKGEYYFLDMMKETIFEMYSSDRELLLDEIDQKMLKQINESLLQEKKENELGKLTASALTLFFRQEHEKIRKTYQSKIGIKEEKIDVMQDLKRFIRNQEKQR